jgi:hypothetical protein
LVLSLGGWSPNTPPKTKTFTKFLSSGHKTLGLRKSITTAWFFYRGSSPGKAIIPFGDKK